MERKALVVDDEIHIVQVVAIKLKNNGYTVFTAENGTDAYQAAIEQNPDVIITDYQMPGMTGTELIEKLRTNPDTVDTPVILLTARSFALDPEVQQQLNICSCLSKPFSPREVLNTVEEVLKQGVSA